MLDCFFNSLEGLNGFESGHYMFNLLLNYLTNFCDFIRNSKTKIRLIHFKTKILNKFHQINKEFVIFIYNHLPGVDN